MKNTTAWDCELKDEDIELAIKSLEISGKYKGSFVGNEPKVLKDLIKATVQQEIARVLEEIEITEKNGRHDNEIYAVRTKIAQLKKEYGIADTSQEDTTPRTVVNKPKRRENW